MLLKLAASKVKSVTPTILVNRDLHNANLAAILSVLVRLIENRLTKFFSVNRLNGNITVTYHEQRNIMKPKQHHITQIHRFTWFD